jgi:signal transduction histidine kinase
MRFLLCLILPLSVLAQRPDTVRLYPVNFLQGMMLGDTNYQDAYMIAELGKIQLERYSKELKQHALQKELENQKLQTASLEQKLLSQRIQAEANQKQQRQQQRISRLEIHSLNQKAMLQERTRDFLVAGVVFLLLVGILLLRLNTKLKTKNAALIQKNREISEALLKGQTIERKRVASELHDSLGGLLSAVKLTMQTIHAEDLSPQEQPIYRNLIGMVNEAGQQVRSLSHNLLPDELEEKGLVNSLERLVTKLNYTQKTHFDLKISGLDERLDKNVEFNLYTICLELCNNILKHAEATEVQIELIKKNEVLQLFVSDNGQGFSVEDTTNGMGMKNLKARASALNAKLHIQSKPYEGTLVSMKMPLVTFAIKNYFFALLFLMSYSAASLGQSSTLDILRKKIKTIEHLPKTYANDTLRVGLLNDLATVTFRTDTVENAIPIARKALQLAQKIKWNHGVLVSYKTLVSAENISNRHYDAIKHGLAGLALAEKLNHRYFRVFFSRSLGNNYDMLDNYEKAIPYYEACLKLSENVEATLPTRANALVELGDAYRVHLKKPLQARHLIEQAIEIYKKVAPASIGYAYDYLGLALTDLNDYPQAEEAFR